MQSSVRIELTEITISVIELILPAVQPLIALPIPFIAFRRSCKNRVSTLSIKAVHLRAILFFVLANAIASIKFILKAVDLSIADAVAHHLVDVIIDAYSLVLARHMDAWLTVTLIEVVVKAVEDDVANTVADVLFVSLLARPVASKHRAAVFVIEVEDRAIELRIARAISPERSHVIGRKAVMIISA
jgi:hypothetical protein